jgi:hypothetical protein
MVLNACSTCESNVSWAFPSKKCHELREKCHELSYTAGHAMSFVKQMESSLQETSCYSFYYRDSSSHAKDNLGFYMTTKININ